MTATLTEAKARALAKTYRPRGKCGSNYHSRGRLHPKSIAVLVLTKGTKSHLGEIRERCFNHLVNTLTYWPDFWVITALDEEDVAMAERAATQAQQVSAP